ncbi:hypothetical protein QJS04_geneDACA005155 [Acorus gramineus]|uniref:Uncharacterized protein n=1 Tax=Acorus gramineus TaxID=55184 RepID=A0AAV9AVC7_ACOGR|nr:hypothetical protein QJS04_geneDACA005155 [Acorus gramineus]
MDLCNLSVTIFPMQGPSPLEVIRLSAAEVGGGGCFQLGGGGGGRDEAEVTS